MDKFIDITVDRDTRILYRNPIKVGNYDALYEIWSWDGIHGTSVIFVSEEVEDLSEEEIIRLVCSALNKDDLSKYTISDGESKYRFVNFGFEVWD